MLQNYFLRIDFSVILIFKNLQKMKYYIIAGEASGDLHASKLMQNLKKIDINAQFRFWGGDLMAEQGGILIKHYKELAFMGLWEVIANINKISKNLNFCKTDILNFDPDAVIFIDYPGFNLKIAEFAHKNNLKTFYYISPKVWVWKKSRIHKIKKFIDKMFVIFPFEVDFYKQYNYDVIYPGNPSVDEIHSELKKHFDPQKFLEQNNLTHKPIIALLPGSRIQEVSKMLPIFKNISKNFTEYQFVVAGISAIPKDLYNKYLSNSDIKLLTDNTYNLLKTAKAAIVTSGTATLETALLNVPQVVCYKTSKFSYSIGSKIIKIDFFSLVNILMKKQVVVELLQNNLQKDITSELNKILNDTLYKNTMLEEYKKLKTLLGNPGAAENTAKNIYNTIKK